MSSGWSFCSLRMLLLNKPLAELTEADLRRLGSEEIREGKTIDYKQALPTDQAEAKKEFLADVSSFANTAGGYLIYGIEEREGIPIKIAGIREQDLEAVALRLESSVRDGIEPRIPVVRTHPVKLKDGAAVVIVEIGRSWAGPHMVTYKGTSRFYARNSAGKYQLDVQEIRAAFIGADAVTQKLRDFRTDRIAKVIGGDLGFDLISQAVTMLHVCPIAAMANAEILSLDQMRNGNDSQHLRPIYSSGWNERITFDGLIRLHETVKEPVRVRSYAQVFRSGCIEAVDCSMLIPHGDPPKGGFPSGVFEHKIAGALDSYLRYARTLGLEPPFVVFLSILNVRDYGMILNSYYGDAPNRVDRDHLLLPELLVENPTMPATVLLKPCFDAIWNACGFDGSFNYNEAGQWQPR